jgi:hypothetical protein
MPAEITLLLSILILVGLAYQIRTTRRVDQKLNKLLAPERGIRRIAAELEKSSRENYRQSEFYSQMLQLLKLDAPIPATRGWAASPDVLLTLITHAVNSKPARILDLGSGMSTLVLGKMAPQASIISIDNSPEYAAKTRALLATHSITNVMFGLLRLPRIHLVLIGMTSHNLQISVRSICSLSMARLHRRAQKRATQ